MIPKILLPFILVFFFCSCESKNKNAEHLEEKRTGNWNLTQLNEKAQNHLDSHLWDRQLFLQDIETYQKYAEVFRSYPLNKSPFPVARYNYAVASNPFEIKLDNAIFKGVRIGEYENPESDKIIDQLTLMVLTNDPHAEETTLVESRNYPYLTAQGIFKTNDHEFDWVFSASPDGYSSLLVNMKHFDLRFGQTILIYPQKNQSFLYHQLNDSPNNYSDFNAFIEAVRTHSKVRFQIESDKNSTS